jgi:hypothetical protein
MVARIVTASRAGWEAKLDRARTRVKQAIRGVDVIKLIDQDQMTEPEVAS